MSILEPLGILRGQAALEAVALGLAFPLGGGPQAFTLVRLPLSDSRRIVAVNSVPPEFHSALGRIIEAPPAWAGFSHGHSLVMGVLNVTPDSFSDGGVYSSSASAIAAGRRMMDDGADILDVGGESSRPGAVEVTVEIEQARVLPVIDALVRDGAVVSVDTRHAATALAAIGLGARIVNDVSGFAFDPAMAGVVALNPVAAIAMHMRGVPATMQQLSCYDDVAVDVTRELAAKLASLGAVRSKIAVDPGIGFAKGVGHNEAMLARLPVLLNLGCRIVVGVSRKSFIGRVSGEQASSARMPGSLAGGLAAMLGGASVLRVHDVAATVQALRVWLAIGEAG